MNTMKLPALKVVYTREQWIRAIMKHGCCSRVDAEKAYASKWFNSAKDQIQDIFTIEE